MMSVVLVIVCSFFEIQCVVEMEEVGFCVDFYDSELIVKGVNYLFDYLEECECMSYNCYEVCEKYNWNNEKEIFV